MLNKVDIHTCFNVSNKADLNRKDLLGKRKFIHIYAFKKYCNTDYRLLPPQTMDSFLQIRIYFHCSLIQYREQCINTLKHIRKSPLVHSFYTHIYLAQTNVHLCPVYIYSTQTNVYLFVVCICMCIYVYIIYRATQSQHGTRTRQTLRAPCNCNRKLFAVYIIICLRFNIYISFSRVV